MQRIKANNIWHGAGFIFIDTGTEDTSVYFHTPDAPSIVEAITKRALVDSEQIKAPEVEAVESKLEWVGEKLAELEFRLAQLESKQDTEKTEPCLWCGEKHDGQPEQDDDFTPGEAAELLEAFAKILRQEENEDD